MAINPIEGTLTLFNTNRGILNGTNLTAFQVAKLVSNQAKALAPTDMGLLRNSIMAKSSTDQTSGFNNQSGEKANQELRDLPANKSAHVGTATNYAIYQEFGTSKQGAQPFLRPAVDLVANKKSTQEVIAKYFTEELNKSTKKKDKVIKIK